jgi:hypothetical protein
MALTEELLWSRHGFLFCNPCRRLDNAAPEHKTKLLKMDTLPQYYQCTAGHTSRAFPTALAPVKYVMKKRKERRENKLQMKAMRCPLWLM